MTRKLRTVSIAALAMLLLAVVSVACGGASLDEVEPAVGVTEVAVQDNSFGPRVIEVAAGTEVTWSWDTAHQNHNVVGDGFRSEVRRDGVFRHRFDTPGTYDYLCALHGGMRGRVIVTD